MVFYKIDKGAHDAVAKQIAKNLFEAVHDGTDGDEETWVRFPRNGVASVVSLMLSRVDMDD